MTLSRRCRSASTIRKKLLHAVEQSSSQMTHDQLALLRSLAASTATKPTPKTLLSRQLSSSEPVSAAVYMAGASSRPSSAASTSLSHHQHHRDHHYQSHKSRNQDSFASTSTPSRSKSIYASSASDAAGPSQRTHGTTRVVGGYKSNTVQLEVELAERLNEIERSKVGQALGSVSRRVCSVHALSLASLRSHSDVCAHALTQLNEKALSRFRACQKTLDTVIQQDEVRFIRSTSD